MSTPWLRPALRWAGLVLLAYLFTLQVVHYSRFHGHLATVPGYDDVVYLYSGYDLATALHKEGFAGWADHFHRLASHAPYSEFLAALAFYPHGFDPRRAYVANVLLVIVFLSCLLYFFRPLKAYVQFPLFACFLTLPFASMIVAEFRPDMAWATLLGFTTIYQVTRRDFYEKLSPSVITGLLAGLSLLSKPSTFAMSILTCLLAFGARFVLEFYRPDPPKFVRLLAPAALRLGIISLLTVAISFPFAFYFGRGIWDYFIFGVFGVGRKVFDSFAHHPWNYYISGPAYDSNLARSGDVLILVALAILYLARRSINRYDKTELDLCLILMMIPYVINNQAPIVSPFLAGAFYGSLIFTLAFVIGRYGPRLFPYPIELQRVEAAGEKKGARTYLTTLVPAQQNALGAVILFFLCLALYMWPPYSDSGTTTAYLRHVHRKLSDYFASAPPTQRICLTQASPIARENVLIWTLQNHQPTPFAETSGLALTVDQAWDVISRDDLIIAQDTGFRGGTPWLPVEKLQDQIVARLKADPTYHLVWQMEDGYGKHLYVFRRDVPAPAGGPFDAGYP